MHGYNVPQPMPTGDGQLVSPEAQKHIRVLAAATNELPEVMRWMIADEQTIDGLCADLQNRIDFGTAKYKTPLKTHNGRDATIDGYQEVLDAIHYGTQDCMENPDIEAIEDVKALIAIATRMRRRLDSRQKAA